MRAAGRDAGRDAGVRRSDVRDEDASARDDRGGRAREGANADDIVDGITRPGRSLRVPGK